MTTSETKQSRALKQKHSPSAVEPPLSAAGPSAGARIAIEGVWPEIDGGRFEIKRSVGDVLTVEADIFCDGHDKLGAALLYRRQGEREWHEVPMRFVDNDRWRGEFLLQKNARYLYTIIAWRDLFASWRDEVSKKHRAGQAISLELIEGRGLVETVVVDARRGSEDDRRRLEALLGAFKKAENDTARLELLMSDAAQELMTRSGLRTNLSRYAKETRGLG